MNFFRAFFIFSIFFWSINSLFFNFKVMRFFVNLFFICFWGNYVINFFLAKFWLNYFLMVNLHDLYLLFIFRNRIYNRLSLLLDILKRLNLQNLILTWKDVFCILFCEVKKVKVWAITSFINKTTFYDRMFLWTILSWGLFTQQEEVIWI